MNAIREIMTRETLKQYEVPEEMGEVFEVILVPVNKIESEKAVSTTEAEHAVLSKAQSANGFSQTVLADESEDVWNDL